VSGYDSIAGRSRLCLKVVRCGTLAERDLCSQAEVLVHSRVHGADAREICRV